MITRRDATALLGAMGLGATALPWARDANAATHVLPEDPAEQNEVWVRIAGRTDEGESIWRVEAGLIRVFDTVHFPPIVLQPMHEVHTYAAPAAQALDESLNSAEAITTGWFAAAFRPWMDMADVAGYLLWHVEKTKLGGLGDLDDTFLAHARAAVKNFDVSPEFDEGPSYLEMRMREQRGNDG